MKFLEVVTGKIDKIVIVFALAVLAVSLYLVHTLSQDAWKFGLKSTYYLRSQSPEAAKAEEGVEDRSAECVGCQ